MSTLKTPASPRPPKPRRESHEYIEYEKYIDGQVQRTRKNVKLVDLASAMVVLVVALLGFFLTAAVLEHWILPGGLGTIGRMVMFVILLAGLGHYAWHTLWPLVSRPINPEYAAVAIEREHPSLKNSLINFLLFRTERGKMPPAVFDALEEQAAQRLAQSPIDDAVDRTPLVRWGYVLLGILILGVVYSLASPKSTFDTARRVVMPWSQIATPSRVRITEITPGNAEIIQGDSLEVRAHIRGLVDGEVVHLSYDTADRQHVEQLVPMSPIDEIGNYGTKLPQGEGHTGIQQHLTYRIVAGDGRSIDYQVTALKAPSIRVREVRYDYPDYTGTEDRTVADRGDIRAIEGTTVTIVAEANGPIESAHLDMEADGTQDIRMKIEGNVATATVDLALPKDRQTPKLSTYQLNMLSTEGVANRKPPQHVLEILPDVAPVVEVLEPAERSREVQLNETVVFRVQASDTDYLLSQVKLHFVKMPDEKMVVEPGLLEVSQPGVDKLDGRWEFTASEYELKPGDIVEYWGEARDNCHPEANVSITERKELVIVAPAEGQQNPNQQRQQGGGEGQQQNQPGQEGQGEPDPNQQGQAGNQGGKGQPDKSQPNQQQQGGEGATDQQQGEPGGAEQQPGEGGEGANNQQQPDGGGEQQQQPGQGANQQNPSEQQPGEGQGSEQQQGAGSQDQQNPGAQGAGPQDSAQQQGTGGGQNQQPPAGGQPRQGEQRPGEPGGGAGTDAQGSPDGQQQPGGGQGAPSPNERRPIASDGSQDGDALQKMNDHLTQEEQQGATRRDANPGEAGDQQPREATDDQETNPEGGQRQEGQPQGAQPKEGQPRGAQPKEGQPQDGQPQGAQPAGEKPSEAQGSEAQGSQAQNKEGANSAGQQSNQTAKEDPLKDLEQKGEATPEGQNMENSARAEGTQPRENQGADTAGGKPEQEPTGEGQEPRDGSKSGGAREDGPQGESGAGDEQNPQGSPEAQEDAAPRDKTPDGGPADKSDSNEAPMPGQGKEESDSSGETGGENPGGGEEGSGQDANHDGTGSAGQNDDAEEGGGKSPEQGSGETGTEAGDAQEAGRETGESGNQAGKGSQQRQGEGNKAGGEQGDQAGSQPQQGDPGKESPQPGEQQGEPGDKPGEQGEQQGEAGDKPGEKGEQPREPGDKRGQPGEQAGGKSPPDGEPGDRRESSGDNSPNNEKYDLAEADKANLEYARKQTDLVLDTLDKQLKENKVDQELLDKLGWSEADLRKFVDRWQGLRRQAAQSTPAGEAAKVELDNRLRKLGPKRGNVEGETKRTEDTLRDLGEGYQSEVPLKYRDKVKRYTEGISK